MNRNLSRRAFLKNMFYLALSLPLVSFITKRKSKLSERPKMTPHEASYYKRLAG